MAVGGQCELQDVNHSDAHPGARCGHTLTHLPGANVNNACSGKLVLFGGTTLKTSSPAPATSSNSALRPHDGGAAAREERTADVHALSLFDGRWRKVAVQPSGPPPPVGRIGHAAVAIGGALLIHGGLAADGAVLDDMHLLRMSRLGTSGHWERIGVVSGGGVPCARYGHSMALLADRYLVVFGGHSGRGAIGDTWVLDVGPGGSGLGLGAADLTAPLAVADEAAAAEAARHRAAQAASGVRETMCAWRQLVCGGCPAPRCFAATAATASTLYVCGGISADQTALSDAFRLVCDRGADGVTWGWRRLPDVPVARVHAAAAVAAGKVHVTGGWVGERRLPEPPEAALVLHEEEGMWDEAALEAGASRALCVARLAVAGCGDVLYAHGGLGAANGAAGAQAPLVHDTYAFSADGASLRARSLQLRSPASTCATDAAPRPPSAEMSPGPSTPESTVPSQPQHAVDDSCGPSGRTAGSAWESTATAHAVSVSPAQPRGADADDDGLMPAVAAPSMTTFVSPYREMSANSQETAILETGLLSGSDAPHVDALSQPNAAAAPRVYEPPPSGRGFEGMKRSGSISRSVMWMPLPVFASEDADIDADGDPPGGPAVDPHALNPYSATVANVHSDSDSVPSASPSAAQRPAHRSFGWQQMDGAGAVARPSHPAHGSSTAGPRAGVQGIDAAPRLGSAAAAGPAAAGSQAAVRKIVRQLDGLKTSRLFGKYAVVKERHVGRRSVIQFAVKGMQRVAIKFFAADAAGRAAFDAEREAVADPALAPLLATALRVYDNAGGEYVDGGKAPLPPAIVYARGTPLNELVTQFWQRNGATGAVDSSELHAPLACAARCLADLHGAGVVHRDVRAAHILWLPASGPERRDRCAFVDLAAAVAAGREVPLSYTLAYAAPELVEADHRGRKRVAAAPQHDEWALGVMMYEALTSHPAFDFLRLGEDGVAQLLRGKHQEQLPWMYPANVEALGAFRKPLCGLLTRDPASRLTMLQFYEACNQELSASTRVVRRGTGFAGDSEVVAGGGGGGSSPGGSCDSPDASGSGAMSKREWIKATGKGIWKGWKKKGIARTSLPHGHHE